MEAAGLYTISSMQQLATVRDRPNISGALVEELREMIVDGRLPAGRLNEVSLAARLGVSRTPLREALGRLTAEGAVTSSPRIGFFIRELSSEEFAQIYPIRAILDVEALRLSGIPSTRRITHLENLNRAIRAAANTEKVISLDDQWHLDLLAGCPNPVLIDLIRQFMRRTRRYEIALMRERTNVHAAADNHQKILRALRRRDLPRACEALRENLEGGTQPVLDWLAAREKRAGK
jgi:DNA-binding GntR family transcriptional regulator